jgi:1-aminocyclopropane-1-carboxylate deaminase/D-cysteine desulfhydrase-like pyridoxal-dependent ACC family enzyme
MPGVFEQVERERLATLPTPLEPGPSLPGGARLWVKRDDLTGLGGGGNKARKLEFLCGAAVAAGARALVTVGAAQSNHCRMTAAAGTRLGLEVHLVLSGDRPPASAAPAGNQRLATLFGAQLHFTGAPASHWGELEIARESLTAELAADGLAPASIPIGGSTAVGALGYAIGYLELATQCARTGIEPAAVVVASSSGGTHAGLLAGRTLAATRDLPVPPVVAVGVARGVNAGVPDVAELANAALALVGAPPAVVADDVEVDPRWVGEDYAVPTEAGDAAIRWGATRGGWLLDRTYSGKGLSGLLGMAAEGRFGAGADVVFVHTGGWPALFAPGGWPGDASAGG